MRKERSVLMRIFFEIFLVWLKLVATFFVMWMAFVVVSQMIDVHPAYALGVGYIVGVVVGNMVD